MILTVLSQAMQSNYFLEIGNKFADMRALFMTRLSEKLAESLL